MARSFVARITKKLPGRSKALIKVTLVDENGFTYEYADLEVPMALARDTVAQLHPQSEAVRAAGVADDSIRSARWHHGRLRRRRPAIHLCDPSRRGSWAD
ncbi:hypothetical protein G3N30_06105 [Microbacterium lacticum]|uniref:hypothetical protein n=1 Tax=Microbacterium lacticum TaxID=33885 RepID=UPI0018B0B686|nr:hypothetical protein [Microbacterium lacticum]MBF9335822.1 hypothetical protein [Microbacterium lacticum]